MGQPAARFGAYASGGPRGRLALHPNDPPLPAVAGVPCLMRSTDAFRRAFALVPAPAGDALGMEFCCGCWLEGGPAPSDPCCPRCPSSLPRAALRSSICAT